MQAISDACASYLSASENASLRNGMEMLHLSSRIYEAYVSRLTRLTLLAPEIVHYIISGKLDKAGAKKCREPFPELWDEQIKFFGIK